MIIYLHTAKNQLIGSKGDKQYFSDRFLYDLQCLKSTVAVRITKFEHVWMGQGRVCRLF